MYRTLKETLLPALPGKLGLLGTLLDSHGEVQVRLSSGTIFSVHLGDEGDVETTSDMFWFKDKEGTKHVILVDQIEGFFMHKGYQE